MSVSDRAKSFYLFRTGTSISGALDVTGCTGKASGNGVSGSLDAVAGSSGSQLRAWEQELPGPSEVIWHARVLRMGAVHDSFLLSRERWFQAVGVSFRFSEVGISQLGVYWHLDWVTEL